MSQSAQPSDPITGSRVAFYLPRSLHDAVVELALANDRPFARELRRALVEYVERHAEQEQSGGARRTA